MIFSPYIKDQNGIEEVLRDYLQENLRRYYKGIEIQRFSDIKDSINSESKIGMGGEVLVIFDRKLSQIRKKPSEWTMNERIYYRGLKQLFELSTKICDEREIPYFKYEGEMEKDSVIELREKIAEMKERILQKLNQEEKGLESCLKEGH